MKNKINIFIILFISFILWSCTSTQEKCKSLPVIFVTEGYTCFDIIEPVIDLSISPYLGTNILEGIVIDQEGETVARVTFKAKDEIDSNKKIRCGYSRDYYGYVDSKLIPGFYIIEFVHNLDKESDTIIVPLEVFKTGLVNEGLLKSQVTFSAIYGNYVIVNAEPNSGGKIKPNQFRTYINTDAEQKPPVQGYTVQQADAPFCGSNTNNISLRITWVQPNTGKEIDIFPQETFPIYQKPPFLNIGDKSVSISGQERKISIRITRLSATGTQMGDAPGSVEKSDVDVSLGKIEFSGIEGFEYVEGSGFVEKGDSGTYSVYFDITGKLPKGQDRIIGTIQVPLSAVAKNTLNGKVSKPDRKMVSVVINYVPEKPGRRKLPK